VAGRITGVLIAFGKGDSSWKSQKMSTAQSNLVWKRQSDANQTWFHSFVFDLSLDGDAR